MSKTVNLDIPHDPAERERRRIAWEKAKLPPHTTETTEKMKIAQQARRKSEKEAAMTAQQCLPPEGAEDGSYHWLIQGGVPMIAKWDEQRWVAHAVDMHPIAAAIWGYRYDRPVPPREGDAEELRALRLFRQLMKETAASDDDEPMTAADWLEHTDFNVGLTIAIQDAARAEREGKP